MFLEHQHVTISVSGAGRPSDEALGNWTREGLLRQAGDRKVEAELFPRAQAEGFLRWTEGGDGK